MAIINNEPIELTADPLTANFCHTSLQATHEEFTNKITAAPVGAAMLAQQTEPTGSDNNKLWLKLDSNDVPIGFFYHNGTTWVETSVPFTAPTGSYGSGNQIPAVTVDDKGRVTSAANTTLDCTSNVSVLTGTIANGNTIPLPSGFTEDQCHWMVGVGTINTVHGDHNAAHQVTFTASSSRVVTTSGIGIGSGVANYIIIGVK